MASIIARRAFSTTARRLATGEEALKTETKKNPEIAVRDIWMPRIPLEQLAVDPEGEEDRLDILLETNEPGS
jgi:hypothetical protein